MDIKAYAEKKENGLEPGICDFHLAGEHSIEKDLLIPAASMI